MAVGGSGGPAPAVRPAVPRPHRRPLEDLRTRGELRARQSWTINGARVAVCAPWLVLALLSTRPQAARAYATTTGGLVLLVGALASAIAYRLMLRLGRLPEEERVLR